MGENSRPEVGAIAWTDLTVGDADGIKNFYRQVVGWEPSPVSMGDYDDFSMTAPASGRAVAGVCHARGGNADLPPAWLIYIVVEDVDRSVARSTELGGKVIVAPKGMGEHGRYAVIEDPAGAVAALFEPAA